MYEESRNYNSLKKCMYVTVCLGKIVIETSGKIHVVPISWCIPVKLMRSSWYWPKQILEQWVTLYNVYVRRLALFQKTWFRIMHSSLPLTMQCYFIYSAALALFLGLSGRVMELRPQYNNGLCMYIRTYHILRYLVSRQVLDILVLLIDDLCQLPSIHHLFKHPHLHRWMKLFVLLNIDPNHAGNSWAPARVETNNLIA